VSTYRTTQSAPTNAPGAADPVAHLHHACQQCGACCRWSGYVIVRRDEVDAIAAHLGVTPEQFANTYARLTSSRRNLSLIEQDDGSCVFLGADNRCRIHPVKPRQCRDFPARWTVPDLETACPAVKAAQGGGQPV